MFQQPIPPPQPPPPPPPQPHPAVYYYQVPGPVETAEEILARKLLFEQKMREGQAQHRRAFRRRRVEGKRYKGLVNRQRKALITTLFSSRATQAQKERARKQLRAHTRDFGEEDMDGWAEPPWTWDDG